MDSCWCQILTLKSVCLNRLIKSVYIWFQVIQFGESVPASLSSLFLGWQKPEVVSCCWECFWLDISSRVIHHHIRMFYSYCYFSQTSSSVAWNQSGQSYVLLLSQPCSCWFLHFETGILHISCRPLEHHSTSSIQFLEGSCFTPYIWLPVGPSVTDACPQSRHLATSKHHTVSLIHKCKLALEMMVEDLHVDGSFSSCLEIAQHFIQLPGEVDG